jgi:hypothetical protein
MSPQEASWELSFRFELKVNVGGEPLWLGGKVVEN